jgi:hypothetical protein
MVDIEKIYVSELTLGSNEYTYRKGHNLLHDLA